MKSWICTTQGRKKERNLLPIIFLSFRTLHLIAQPTITGGGGAKHFFKEKTGGGGYSQKMTVTNHLRWFNDFKNEVIVLACTGKYIK